MQMVICRLVWLSNRAREEGPDRGFGRGKGRGSLQASLALCNSCGGTGAHHLSPLPLECPIHGACVDSNLLRTACGIHLESTLPPRQLFPATPPHPHDQKLLDRQKKQINLLNQTRNACSRRFPNRIASFGRKKSTSPCTYVRSTVFL